MHSFTFESLIKSSLFSKKPNILIENKKDNTLKNDRNFGRGTISKLGLDTVDTYVKTCIQDHLGGNCSSMVITGHSEQSLNPRCVDWLAGFYGISTFVGYLMPSPFLYKLSVLFQAIQFSIKNQFHFKVFSLT